MQIRILLIGLLLCCLACRSNRHETKPAKFDPAKWAAKDGPDYPARDGMLNDLMRNHTLHGLKRGEVIDLLGQPGRTDGDYLFYTVSQERLGALILHTKTLVIELGPDSTVEWRKIHE